MAPWKRYYSSACEKPEAQWRRGVRILRAELLAVRGPKPGEPFTNYSNIEHRGCINLCIVMYVLHKKPLILPVLCYPLLLHNTTPYIPGTTVVKEYRAGNQCCYCRMHSNDTGICTVAFVVSDMSRLL